MAEREPSIERDAESERGAGARDAEPRVASAIAADAPAPSEPAPSEPAGSPAAIAQDDPGTRSDRVAGDLARDGRRVDDPAGEPSVSAGAAAHDEPRVSADDLAAQNELLGRAADAVKRGQGEEALRFTSEHASRFPGSPLADLRTALRIEALCAATKPAQARAEGRQFLENHANSPVARRISRSCAGLPRKPGDADTPGT
jgi:hypothetical protein